MCNYIFKNYYFFNIVTILPEFPWIVIKSMMGSPLSDW